MKEIQTSILIQAPSSRVWQVLTDFEAMPAWNPFIKKITGDRHEGGRLIVTLQPPGGSGMTFKPRILAFTPGREFRWKGQLILPGIFDGEHYFIIEETNAGACRFIHGERFTGILVGLLGSMLKNTEKGFQMMNEALKARCEQ